MDKGQSYRGSCDAYSPTLGHGTWCYFNGGMWAKLGTHTLPFRRQEPICGGKPANLPSLYH